MAKRPVFLRANQPPLVSEAFVEFEWYPGFSRAQKQRSIQSLHSAAKRNLQLDSILEVSTKSLQPLGTSLSAFNLLVSVPDHGMLPLESAFQGSKVFSNTGKLDAAYVLQPREAKALARSANEREKLVAFEFGGRTWPLEPKSWFYDWLYLRAVQGLDPEVRRQIGLYEAFTDIEFNPAKSFSCQARSTALAATLSSQNALSRAVDDPDYLRMVAYPVVQNGTANSGPIEVHQSELF